MSKYWIAYGNGSIEIITSTDDNDDKVLRQLMRQHKWEWGTLSDMKTLDEEQTKTFIKKNWSDFEDLTDDEDKEDDE